jgi:hypothetical protein
MASLESWSDVMYSGSDAVAFGEQPIRNYNRPISLLFILFIMVGCFFMLNLIIGVSIDKVRRALPPPKGLLGYRVVMISAAVESAGLISETHLCSQRIQPPFTPLFVSMMSL